MKMTGAEFKAWQNSDWGDGYWEEYELSINGVAVEDFDLLNISDADKIVVTGGIVFESANDRDGRSAQSHFNRWKKSITVKFLSLQVDKDDLPALQEVLAQFGKGRRNFKLSGGD